MRKIFNLGKKLFPICRSITGKGVRQTLKIIKKFEPMNDLPTTICLLHLRMDVEARVAHLGNLLC